MKWLATQTRRLAKWQFKLRGLATVTDLSTDKFNELLLVLQAEGWTKTHEYSGFDAWIDYGCVHLKKHGVRLKFEWDNWDEGSVEGPEPAIKLLADRFGYHAKSEWRWSSWDQPQGRT